MAQVKLHKLSYTADELDARLAKIDENFEAIVANTDADNEFKESVAETYATKAEVTSLGDDIAETYATKAELNVVAKQVGPAIFTLNFGAARNMSTYEQIQDGAALFTTIRDNFAKGIPTLIVNGTDKEASSVDDDNNPVILKVGDVYSCIYAGTNQFNYATIENWSNKQMCLLRIQGLLDNNKKVIGAQYQTSLLTY